jgi:hypothetical protein
VWIIFFFYVFDFPWDSWRAKVKLDKLQECSIHYIYTQSTNVPDLSIQLSDVFTHNMVFFWFWARKISNIWVIMLLRNTVEVIWYLFVIYLVILPVAQAAYCQIAIEWCILKNVEGNGHGLFKDNHERP